MHRPIPCAYCEHSFSAEQIADPDWRCPTSLEDRHGRPCFFRS
jgi:hypothetical protein